MAVEGRTHRPVIDYDRCGECMICMNGCPAALLPAMRREQDSLRGAFYGRTEAAETDSGPVSSVIPATVAPRCQTACPLGQDVRGYLQMIGEGRFAEALALIREANPLPTLCGAVCHHPCTSACTRAAIDDPLDIRELKRFAAAGAATDDDTTLPIPATSTGRHIYIVGAGPAGLTAAHDLVRRGHRVTVLEAAAAAGGMAEQVIPPFRLPRAALRRDIDYLRRLGVEIETSTRFGHDVTAAGLCRRDAAAIILAVGTSRGVPLEIDPGIPKATGRYDCLTFLRAFAAGRPPLIAGDRVIVVGGGNAAVDAARAARRAGAGTVTILYRREREAMPADGDEIAAAEREGITFIDRAVPHRLLTANDRVTGLGCRTTRPAATDSAAPPAALPDSDFTLTADLVIAAVGQRLDTTLIDEHLPLELTPRLTVAVHGETRETSIPGIFAAGDAVLGPSTVVEAMADGRRAAMAVHHRIIAE
ncbi:MAG: FAD-dependent oxidoreductase [Deltaproteobacteria bacterium]|nr:FAD-dependent oxidoreductase [Candidatus Anaeroferrophillacea bacterium]